MTILKSFRFRIFISLWGFGILLVILYAMVAVYFSQRPAFISRQIYAELKYEWEYFTESYKSDNNHRLPQSRLIKTYTHISDLPSAIQATVSGIGTGYHAITLPEKVNKDMYHIAVQNHPNNASPIYMLYDYNRLMDESEMNFKNRAFNRFSVAFIIIAALSIFIGYFLAKRIIAPLNKLSRLVHASDPENLPVDISKGFSDNEIGALAISFETTLQRIREFIEREKCFTRDASHELRTPVAIIKGAVELMHAIPDSKNKTIDRLMQRIERSIKNMEVTIETFLWLGRESSDVDVGQHTHIRDVVAESVAENQYLLKGKHVAIDLKIADNLLIRAPEPILKIAIVNLVRNAFYYTHEGQITIFSNTSYFEIKDTGVGVQSTDLNAITELHVKSEHSKGFGLGLAIVDRLCKRFNWVLDISSHTKTGTQVRITFSS